MHTLMGTTHFCKTCGETLHQWIKRMKKSTLEFQWSGVKPGNHVYICWFCITPAYGATNKTKHKIQYPYLDSAILPVPHSTEIPVPLFVKFEDYVDLNSSFVFEADDVTDPDFLDISEISIGSLIILNDLSSFWLPGLIRTIFFILAHVSHTVMKEKRKHVSTLVEKKALSFVIILKDFCYTLVQYPMIHITGTYF